MIVAEVEALQMPHWKSEPELLHHFFERQARLRPGHAAVECDGITLTYAQLDKWSDQAALMLNRRGFGPGSLIALYSEKSVHLFAAMLGILKAGAGYVPIDPGFPIARIRSILSDANVKIVFSDGTLARDLSAQVAAEVISLTALFSTELDSSLPVVPVAVGPQDPCYVIYTSGSTGEPKGVVIEHRHAVNFVHALHSVYRLTERDRIYQGFSIAFDASVEEIWAALSLGGTLVVPSGEISRSTFEAADFINSNNISYFSTVPSFLSMIDADLPGVRLLVLGGEACSPSLVTRWATPTRRMLNTYGPTEATVVATAADCVPGELVTIGRPLPGYETYVLNEQLVPVGPGEMGELYIGGNSVARGYLNRSELTAERFVANPFRPDAWDDGRVYRTFDLVRLGENGDLHFIGRADSQVKIRGFRVELAEIEAVLTAHPSIRLAAVKMVELGALNELAAYVVLEPDVDGLDRDGLLSILRERLPEYMVPKYLDVVQCVPTMTSGKVDRSRLPAPETLLWSSDSKFVAATTDNEKIIVAALESEFKLSAVSVDADFFVGLRGHSLNAARVVTRLRATLGSLQVSVSDMYAHRTARLLAQHLDDLGIKAKSAPPDPRASADEPAKARPSRFRYACAALQVVSLVVFYGILSGPVALAVVLALLVSEGRMDLITALDLATGAAFLIWPSWLALSVAVKWLVIGRYKPGRYRVWGFYYFRWWLVTRFQSLSWSEVFVGTPLMSLYYRAMGAKVGKNCTIETSICSAFDLVAIGDNASIGSDTHVLGYRVEDGWLILGNVTVGADCYVGTHSCLGLNTAMGDAARLGDMSHLADNTAIATGEGMSGSPAEPTDVRLEDLQAPLRRWRGSAFLFGMFHLGLIYVMGYILILSMLPGIVLIGTSLYFYGPAVAAVAVFAAAPITMIWYLALVVFVKRVAIGQILPGVYDLHSRDYLRYWFLNYLLNNTRRIAVSLYATLFFPKFLRWLGAKVGRDVEISTAMHVMPDLLEIGEGSFLADACIVGGHRTCFGRIALHRNVIGRRSFVGNSALVPTGIDVGDNSLIGVMSTPPLGTARTGDGTRWLGSPGFELPNTQRVGGFADDRTFAPGYGLVLSRAVVESLRLVLPGIVMAATFVLFCIGVALAYQHLPLWSLFGVAAIEALVLSAVSVSIVALVKVVLIDRFEPTVKPLWCSFIWLNEVVNALYEAVAAPAMAPLMGTPFAASCLRLMGCRVGKWAFVETTLFSEFDLVEIGDYASLNLGATIQTHLFEDRVMKADRLKIGDRCTVGNMAIVLYATEMKCGSSLGALSVLMKGEVLPEFSSWLGIPTRPIQAIATPARQGATVALPPRQLPPEQGVKPASRRQVLRKQLFGSSSHTAIQGITRPRRAPVLEPDQAAHTG
jgi:non-ribosomal peptide synthetase-like protein